MTFKVQFYSNNGYAIKLPMYSVSGFRELDRFRLTHPQVNSGDTVNGLYNNPLLEIPESLARKYYRLFLDNSVVRVRVSDNLLSDFVTYSRDKEGTLTPTVDTDRLRNEFLTNALDAMLEDLLAADLEDQ